MTSEIRTFIVTDGAGGETQAELSAFLRSVEVQRIDTAYADGAWRVLVMFEDLKRKEESAQIESAILGALSTWRDKVADRVGMSRDMLLPDELLSEIARYAPTTEHELQVILSGRGKAVGQHGAEIVQVVRHMLEALVD